MDMIQTSHLATGIRRNIKNYLLPLLEKTLLRKRFIIETLFDKLKSGMGLEHTRHRPPTNVFVHLWVPLRQGKALERRGYE